MRRWNWPQHAGGGGNKIKRIDEFFKVSLSVYQSSDLWVLGRVSCHSKRQEVRQRGGGPGDSHWCSIQEADLHSSPEVPRYIEKNCVLINGLHRL